MRIYVVAAMHGDEQFGLKVLKHLDKANKNLRIKVGHPAAIEKNVRYIDSDLNRSFRSSNSSIEARLAKEIERDITAFAPDCVIDIHTSVTAVGKAAIIAQYNDQIEHIAQALGMENIILMSQQYTEQALIGCLPDRSISLEFGSNLRSDDLAQDIAQRINKLQQAKSKPHGILPRYEIISTIPKGYQKLTSIVNLQYSQDLKAYPFLAGQNAYLDMGGFLARKVN